MVFQLCDRLTVQGETRVSSTEIGRKLGVTAHTVRKDINYLGEIGDTGSGYEIVRLRQHLGDAFGFNSVRKACVVGLGRLGSAMLDYEKFVPGGFSVVAGFDSNINRLETIRTGIDVYPAYEVAEVVRRRGIELALIAVPASAAQDVADALVQGGIKGIVNFAPVVIKPSSNEVSIRNMDVLNEMRILLSLMTLKSK
jgi:redox-sensing transcriptional repressor